MDNVYIKWRDRMLGSVEDDNKQGFPNWEAGGQSPHQPKIYLFRPPLPPPLDSPPHQIFNSPLPKINPPSLNNNFQVITQ